MTLPDIDSLATFGGQKANEAPLHDSSVQEDATDRNEFVTDVAMMTHTAVRAMARFAGHGTTPADPGAGFIHDALHGSSNAVKPTKARTGAGVFTLTWPTTVTDELSVSHTLNFRFAKAWVESSGTLYHATARVTAANIVEVRTFTAAGVADDVVGQNVVVLVW